MLLIKEKNILLLITINYGNRNGRRSAEKKHILKPLNRLKKLQGNITGKHLKQNVKLVKEEGNNYEK
mgnify:CR=1 FL=1